MPGQRDWSWYKIDGTVGSEMSAAVTPKKQVYSMTCPIVPYCMLVQQQSYSKGDEVPPIVKFWDLPAACACRC